MKKIMFISLGCDKNLVDTEKMLTILGEEGYSFTDDEQEAEIIIINSCCFIGDAKEESINTIIEMGELKKNGPCELLIVTGCLAERYKDEVLELMPEVDGILGIGSWDEIACLIRDAYEKKEKAETEEVQETAKPAIFKPNSNLPLKKGRVVTTNGFYAYLKIAEGCNKSCTYCIIPKIRGPYRSVPMEDLLEEAQELADKGVRELVLVAQETTLYGVDLYGKKSLPELLRKLCRIDGLYWIRILYCYPEEITEELIEVMKEEEKICHYLDIPIQHASDAVLKKMGRRTTRAEITGRIARLREEIPDIVLRTTLIAGFPGETEEDHEECMDFIDEIGFDRLGVFSYSREEETRAGEMEDQIPDEVKDARRDELMELQQEIAFDINDSLIGEKMWVFIEGKVADEPAYVGRTYMDAPGVDGLFFVQTGELLMSGDFVECRVTATEGYDLIGVIADADEFTE